MSYLDVPIQLRWSDVDVYGHVNNVATLALVEQARVSFFAQARYGEHHLPQLQHVEPDMPQVFLTGQAIEYRHPIRLRLESVLVRLWVTRVGAADFELGFEIRQTVDGDPAVVCAHGLNGLVLVDPQNGRPMRLSSDDTALLQQYLGAAPHLRRLGR
ncbi:acyl-CoA thioesterase [Pseudoclavibacter soli]|uniref:acyl-CoA thioesterase n=1 Tax=Pseudoclavibacter soli TaxID=452623 RepID=UPI0004010C54|nr:thioesterase family protein [Pseudoclavibacter soli]